MVLCRIPTLVHLNGTIGYVLPGTAPLTAKSGRVAVDISHIQIPFLERRRVRVNVPPQIGPDTSLYKAYCILRGSDRFRFVQMCVHIKATVSALSVHRINFREIYQYMSYGFCR